MNFFERQAQARSQTRKLIFLFGASVVAITILINLALYFFLQPSHPDDIQQSLSFFSVTSTLILVTIALGTLYKFHQVSDGGSSTALMLGAKAVNPTTSEPKERRLVNIIEEMAIASGVPVPQIFVLSGELGINAFAAGFNSRDAAITVTEGTLRHLDRDELQGVIAHEFSHILNADMRLNMQLLATTSGIAILAQAGRLLMDPGTRPASRRGRQSGRVFLIGLTLFLLGWIGVFFAKLIQAAISRQREFLADASAIQFTRNPDGIGNALKKIGGLSEGSRIGHPSAQELAHFFFSSVEDRWFATHPPLLDRLLAIDPQFDGNFSSAKFNPKISPVTLSPHGQERMCSLLTSNSNEMTPSAWSNAIGQITPKDSSIEIPQSLRASARDPFHSRNLFYALFLSRTAELQSLQIKLLSSSLGREDIKEVLSNAKLLIALDYNKIYFAILNLSLPSLRVYSKEQFRQLTENLKILCEADQSLTLLEYASYKLIKNYRETPLRPKAPNSKLSLKEVQEETVLFLSMVAYESGPAAETMFLMATRSLQILSPKILAPNECTLRRIESALDRLSRANSETKRQIISAAMEIVLQDQRMNQNEAALLQVAGAVMGVPIPSPTQSSRFREAS